MEWLGHTVAGEAFALAVTLLVGDELADIVVQEFGVLVDAGHLKGVERGLVFVERLALVVVEVDVLVDDVVIGAARKGEAAELELDGFGVGHLDDGCGEAEGGGRGLHDELHGC